MPRSGSVWVGGAKGNASFRIAASLPTDWQGIFKQRQADGGTKTSSFIPVTLKLNVLTEKIN